MVRKNNEFIQRRGVVDHAFAPDIIGGSGFESYMNEKKMTRVWISPGRATIFQTKSLHQGWRKPFKLKQ